MEAIDVIEDILAVIGLVSLILTLVRIIWAFFDSGTEWVDNVTITEKPYVEEEEYLESGTGIYPTYFKGEKNVSEFATATTFSPQSTIIRNLKIKKVTPESIEEGDLKYRTVKIIKTVTPQNPLCMVLERGEAIAPYMLEWRIDYGAKATYYFYENMRDGYNDRKGIEYTFNLISKIRKLLDLK